MLGLDPRQGGTEKGLEWKP